MTKKMTIELLIADEADEKAMQDELTTLMSKAAEHNPDMRILGWQLPERQNVAVVMDGGIIQAVVAENPELMNNINLVLMDYDTDGADEHDLVAVPQGDGREEAAAYMRELDITKARIDLERAYARFLDQVEPAMPGMR